MSGVVSSSIHDGVGVVTIDYPPVNALSIAVRRALETAFSAFLGDTSVDAIVLICAGRTFFAGGDITEFGQPLRAPFLATVFDMIESASKPVIAAIHGTALGGGLEVALACHHRVAVSSARLGLPEVTLGLIPGAGGTQRLPRIVGVQKALEMMTTGRPVSADEALTLGLIDALAPEADLRDFAIAFARARLQDPTPLARVRDRDDKIAPARGKPEIFAEFRRRNARGFRNLVAPGCIIAAVEAAVELQFDAGIAREAALFIEAHDSTQSASLRYAFFAERETAKIPDVPPATPTSTIGSVGVIGAGTMGGGIAMNFLTIGTPVTLIETDQDRLDRGIAVIRRNYETSARKGKLTSADVERRMALITQALSLDALRDCDLVIEAAFESMAVKKQIFTALDAIAKPDAILATNTSFLDIDEIASVTARPHRVIGLHFFSPANVMRLLEVVRGRHTAPDLIATAMKLAKRIGKVPVLSRVCDGFIANRLMVPRMHAAEALVLEGPTPAEIDRVIYDYGFAMGPFQMIDLVGLDVIGRDADVRTLRGDLVALGRLGQKQGGGFYDYDEQRVATPSSVAAAVIADFAHSKGIVASKQFDASAILARLLYPVVNEGARILEEGIALRASDIDMAAILGYNWPAYTGGPMFWADSVGLDTIVAGLDALATEYGPSYAPAGLLRRLAAEGGAFTRH